MGQAIKLNGRRVGRGPINSVELINIGKSMSEFINTGKLDKDFQSRVTNRHFSTLSLNNFINAREMKGIGGKT